MVLGIPYSYKISPAGAIERPLATILACVAVFVRCNYDLALIFVANAFRE
jgi:hypothetical protein